MCGSIRRHLSSLDQCVVALKRLNASQKVGGHRAIHSTYILIGDDESIARRNLEHCHYLNLNYLVVNTRE